MNNELAAKWLEYAKMDLQSAKTLFQYDPIPNIVAFHGQQAVEKSLKAYLIF